MLQEHSSKHEVYSILILFRTFTLALLHALLKPDLHVKRLISM